MPTVFEEGGWKISTRSNERFEKFHVHAESGDKNCKVLLTRSSRKTEVTNPNKMRSKDIKCVERIVLNHFKECWESWEKCQEHRGVIGYSS